MGSVAASRLGLWMFDLSVMQQMQVNCSHLTIDCALVINFYFSNIKSFCTGILWSFLILLFFKFSSRFFIGFCHYLDVHDHSHLMKYFYWHTF